MSTQPRPHGGKITIDQDERKRLQDARKAKGWTQKQLADKVKVTGPTISNLETGRHPQIYKTVYADLLRVLFGKEETPTDPTAPAFRSLTEKLADFDAEQLATIEKMVDLIKKR